MDDLTQRQIDILNAIIKEYTETGMPVGSVILEKKYKLGICPATIRNEMVELAKKNYLKKDYFSSGRVPSAKAFRFYIKNLMKEKELPTTEEVSFKNSIWDERKEPHRLLFQATKTLSQKTGYLALTTTNHGDLYYSGVANLLTKREFFDLSVTRNIFELLDEVNYWLRLLDKVLGGNEDVYYFLGEEDFRDPIFEETGSVFGEFETQETKGIIGVLGPKRMNYDLIIPQVRYLSQLLEEMMG